MKSKKEFVLAIDAGGTFFKSSIIDSNGAVVEGSLNKAPVDSNGGKENILSAYEKIIGDANDRTRMMDCKISGIGISTPGPFDYEGCRSLMLHKFQSIYGMNLKDFFVRSCKVPPDTPVRFLHDVHAFILGEHWNGNAKGYRRVVAVTIGTGVGFGAIVHDKILHNGQGGPYVSIYGKPCKAGILEDYVSAKGIVNEYCRRSGRSDSQGIDAKEIGRRAEVHQDMHAVELYRQVGELIGDSILETLKELRIECLVLGGQISRSFSLMEAGLRLRLAEIESLEKITEARNIDESPLIGAAKMVYTYSNKRVGDHFEG